MGKRLVAVALLAVGALAGCGLHVSHRTSSERATAPAAVAPIAAPSAVAATTSAGPAPKPRAAPKPNACEGNGVRQLVLVSVPSQHVWMCGGTRLVYTAAVTTGAVDLPYDSTPTGTYTIQAKQTDQTLTLLGGAQYQVNYWIPFDGPLFGFHDASWQSFPFGSARYRTEGSHGCVHMPLAAIAFLYRWADVGATVTIRA